MASMKEPEDRSIKFPYTKASKDLLIIFVIFILVFVLSYFFDVFLFIVRFVNKYPSTIFYIDEVVTSLLTLSIGFAVFAWRRWLELKKETAARISLQEELIRIAYTKAETEKIINKQLRSEIDIRKQGDTSHSPKVKRKIT